jgi:hypothetical protein
MILFFYFFSFAGIKVVLFYNSSWISYTNPIRGSILTILSVAAIACLPMVTPVATATLAPIRVLSSILFGTVETPCL